MSRTFYRVVFNFVFPVKCMSCRKIIKSDNKLCDTCLDSLCFTDTKKRCKLCGTYKPDCDCKSTMFYFSEVVSPFINKDSAKNIVYAYKLSNKMHYANYLTFYMTETFNKEYKDIAFDYVTFVPPSKKEFVLNGFNHSYLLAKGVSKSKDIPLVKNVLGAKSKGLNQHNKTYAERFSYAKDKFYHKRTLRAKNVLLVDDIKTSGATLSFCAKQLLLSGAQNVYCLTAVCSQNKTKK